MKKFDNLYSLIEDIENLTDGLLISGFSVANTGTLKNIQQKALNCEGAGLSFAANILKEIYEGGEKKRHDMTYSGEELLPKYFLLNNYISVIKNRLDLERARGNMELSEGLKG